MDIISKVIRGVDEFPTLPTIYQALSELMANPNSTHADAGKVISSDQASATKVLKVANSALYGFKGQIDTITQAIFYIGFAEIKNLVLALSILDIFRKTEVSYRFNPVELWKHSIAVGIVSRIIAQQIGIRNLENYFLSGVLHDIGKLLFYKNLEDIYVDTIEYASEKMITIREAESEKLGISHTVAGELVAEKWKLPNSIKNSIRYHYIGYVDGKFDQMTSVVHIANIVSRALKFGYPGDNLIPEPNLDVWRELTIEPNFFTKNYKRFSSEYSDAVSMFMLI